MKVLRVRKITFGLLFFLLLIVVGNAFFIAKIATSEEYDPQISQIEAVISGMNTTQLDELFSSIAQEQGAVVAFDVLRKVTIPKGIDAHVIGHTIGTILYQQHGVKGMRYCTDEFNNACSHAMVIEHFTKKGEGVIKEIAAECSKVPGGRQGYTMCFHGLGHGVFAYYEYSFERTIPMCRKAGKEETGVEFSECVGGAVMESISGGRHSLDVWQKNTAKYFKDEDPLYPCNSALFPDDAKPICYTYLTPRLFQEAGFGIGILPTDAQLAKAFSFCDQITLEYLRRSCLEGFGKELVSMSNDWNSDIAGKNPFTPDKAQRLSKWCHVAPSTEAKNSCLLSSASVLYWGGIKDAQYANMFCMTLTGDEKDECFTNFIEQVWSYAKDKKKDCRQLDTEWQEACLGN